jgi:hypothetical protein
LTEERPIDDPEQMPTPKTRMKKQAKLSWDLESDRRETWEAIDDQSAALWAWLMKGPGRALAPAIGLVLDEHEPPPTVFRSTTSQNKVAVQVHSVRSAVRRSPRGGTVTDLVVEITQRRRGYFGAEKQKQMDASGSTLGPDEKGDFTYRAGCTLLINPVTMKVRRVIRSAGTIADDIQLSRIRQFLSNELEPTTAFYAARATLYDREPFALLHRDAEE